MTDLSRRDFMETSAAGLLAAGLSVAPGQDLCFTPATALAAAIRAKKVSPVEVMSAVYEGRGSASGRS